MDKVYWSSVLSFLVPGLGQISKSQVLAGYVWFISYAFSIFFVIKYSIGWLILT